MPDPSHLESACTSVITFAASTGGFFRLTGMWLRHWPTAKLALCANSPYFFGHQLVETRIEPPQSTDARPEELVRGCAPGMVWRTLDHLRPTCFRRTSATSPTLLPRCPTTLAELADASHTEPNCGCITNGCTGGTGLVMTWSTAPYLRLENRCYLPGRRSLTCWRIMPSTTAHYAVCPRPTPLWTQMNFAAAQANFLAAAR